MKVGFVVVIFAAVAFAGCMAGETANPNLAAPKLVIATRAEGEATVFVHSAFGERQYDWIRLEVDNVTLLNRTSAFSVEQDLASGFFLDAQAGLGDVVYVLRGRVDVFRAEDHASVSLVDAKGVWPEDAESFGLPFEHLLERRAEVR